jgi:hypothetical protein
MNSKTVLTIVVMGMLALFAFVIMAMMGFQKLAEKPLVRVAVEIAERHKVKEVSLGIDPPEGNTRTLKLAYETNVTPASLDLQRDEMEAIARFAHEKVKAEEGMQVLLLKRDGKAPPNWGPFEKVAIRRTWRNERGCYGRSDEAAHEWVPPPPKPR